MKAETGIRRQRNSTSRPTVVGSEVHDGDHEELDRQEFVLRQQIAQIDEIIRTSTIADQPTGTDRLRLGHIVTIQRYDVRDNRIGKPERYLIGGYQETDINASPKVLSYDSPLLAQLMGRTVDPDRDPARVALGGKTIGVELLQIELNTKFKAANAA